MSKRAIRRSDGGPRLRPPPHPLTPSPTRSLPPGRGGTPSLPWTRRRFVPACRLHPAPVLLVLLALALALGGCDSDPLQDFELLPVPEPDLSTMETTVQEQLRGRREVLTTRQTAPEPAPLAEAFGDLGRHYHAYRLHDAARASYLNARRLTPADHRWAYYLGVLHQRLGELDQGAEHLGKVLAAAPRDLPALLRLGRVELARGRPEEAAGYFEQALAVDPASAAALFGLGEVAAAAGEFRTAVERFEATLELQPQATQVNHPLGMAYRSLGDSDRARAFLERRGDVEVAFADPLMAEVRSLAVSSSARLLRAGRAARAGRFEAAEREYRQALTVAPENVEARMSFAAFLAHRGELDAAAAEYREAIRRAPGQAVAYHQLGRLLTAQGSPAAALEPLGRAIELEPEQTEFRHDRARALAAAGRRAEAVREYGEILALDPQDATAGIERAGLLAALGRGTEAVAELRRMTDGPDAAAARLMLGKVLAETGEVEAAMAEHRAVLEAAAATDSEKARAHANLATAEAARGRFDAAIEHSRSALELDPELLPVRLALGALLARQGDHAGAARQFRGALERDPSNGRAWQREVLALIAAGDWTEASRRLHQALTVLPEDPNLAHLLARLLATAGDGSVRDAGKAVILAQAVFEDTRLPLHAETVAMALAAVGRFGEAMEAQRAILAQAEAHPDLGAGHLARLSANLARYQQGRPCIDPWGGAAAAEPGGS